MEFKRDQDDNLDLVNRRKLQNRYNQRASRKPSTASLEKKPTLKEPGKRRKLELQKKPTEAAWVIYCAAHGITDFEEPSSHLSTGTSKQTHSESTQGSNLRHLAFARNLKLFSQSRTLLERDTDTIPRSLYNCRHEAISRLAVEIGSLHHAPWTPHPWFWEVPRASFPPSFQYGIYWSLEAISVAFEAKRRQDWRLRNVAFSRYAAGLRLQQAQLRKFSAGGFVDSQNFTQALLFGAISLMEFEMLIPNPQQSWSVHAYGALDILLLCGPQLCRSSPFFEIFWHLRFVMVRHYAELLSTRMLIFVKAYLSIYTHRPSPLGDPAWIEQPFRVIGKSDFDRLIDTLLQQEYQQPQSKHSVAEIEGSFDMAVLRSCATNNGSTAENPDVSQQISRILAKIPLLINKSSPERSDLQQLNLAMDLFHDAENILQQTSIQFSAALQAIFAVSLISRLAMFEAIKHEMELFFIASFRRISPLCFE